MIVLMQTFSNLGEMGVIYVDGDPFARTDGRAYGEVKDVWTDPLLEQSPTFEDSLAATPWEPLPRLAPLEVTDAQFYELLRLPQAPKGTVR